jgi:hypothetical protein
VSRFTSHLGLQLVENDEGDPIETADGRCVWEVIYPLTYDVGVEGSGESITVPAGATTDLASIPRFAWSIGFPPDGPWLKAAVVHDFLYRSNGNCSFGGRVYRTRMKPYSRKEADGVLREAMKVLGVGGFERFVIYEAVRVGGARGWGT